MMTISDQEFARFQRFIYDVAGISLSSAKKALVSGRLSKRLHHHKLDSFSQYYELLVSGREAAEMQTAIDLLTTNETYFFREKKHFDLLRELAMAKRGSAQTFRVWSAACSSGEESYSIAMVLADCLEDSSWEVIGSDISARVLQHARAGHYSSQRATQIPPAYLQRFCLKGFGKQEGTLLIERSLRNRVQFAQVNLNRELPKLGVFDVIFLRNVMIYFNNDTKRQIVARMLPLLKPDGHLLIGHSETLNELGLPVKPRAPSIYRKA